MGAKKGLKSSELCRTLDIQPYVLRYWETEFKALQAPAGATGQRSYTESEVALVRRIKQLLYEEGYTIAGAKKKLESEPLEPHAHGDTVPMFEAPAAEASDEVEEPEAVAAASTEKSDAAPVSLDSDSPERIKQLRRGISEALAEAKSVLKLLDKHPR
jgi:DNA-binding transcriptional MerR regulator